MAVTVGTLIAVLEAKTRQFEFGLKRASQSLDPLAKKVDDVSRRMARLGKVLTVTGGIAAAFGIGFSKSVIDAASTSEKLRIRLNALLGSVEEGGLAFKKMTDFAARVPFEFEEIMRAATQLSGIVTGGANEIARIMPMIADLAAVSGLSIDQTTQQIIRAFSAGIGSADLFRERGIVAMLGFQAGATVSAEETRRQIVASYNDIDSKFRGAAQSLAFTWTGLMSMISDRWFQFRNLVAEAGIFNAAKNQLQGFLDRMGALQRSGEMDAIAQRVSDALVRGIETAIRGVGHFLDAANTAIRFLAGNSLVASFGLVGLLLLGPKGAAAFAILGAGIDRLISNVTGSTTEFGKSAERVAALGSALSRARFTAEAFNQIVERGGTLTKAQIQNWIQAGISVIELERRLADANTTLDGYTDRNVDAEGPLSVFQERIDALAEGMKTFTLNTEAAGRAVQQLEAPPSMIPVPDEEITLRFPTRPPPKFANPLLKKMEELREKFEQAQDAAFLLSDIIGNAIGNSISDVVSGVQTISEAFADVGKTILRELVSALVTAIAKAIVFKAVMSFFGFKDTGNIAKGFLGFEQGGRVPGSGPVPAILHGGEFVLSQSMLADLATMNREPAHLPSMQMAPGAQGMTSSNINVDFSTLPAPMTPREGALNAAWQDLLRETILQIEQGGFRFAG